MEAAHRGPGIDGYLAEVRRTLDALPAQIGPAVEALLRAYRDGSTIFMAGNGGSASNASHFAHDLCKVGDAALKTDRRFRTISLTDNVPFLTAVSNDFGYEHVFVQQLMTLARAGDVFVVFSGSGNSPNVVRAAEYANAHEMTTIGITGFAGGAMAKLSRVHVNIPTKDIGLAEALHGVAYHVIMAELAVRLKEEPALAR